MPFFFGWLDKGGKKGGGGIILALRQGEELRMKSAKKVIRDQPEGALY